MMFRFRRWRACGGALAGSMAAGATLLALASCADPAAPGSKTGGPVTGTVTVLAASSLTEVLTALGDEFEADHPGATVEFSFGGSSGLAAHLEQGAPADVYAAADPRTMARVTAAGRADQQPRTLARNELVIGVAAGNPLGIAGLADLTDAAVAICAEQVPCGAATARALDVAGASLTPRSLERSARGAASKVALGEVDAALIYHTDARAVAGVDGVHFPEAAVARNDYQVVPLSDAPNSAGAEAFVELMLSERGRAELAAAGFVVP